jgi:preprotein translocase subunit SecE
MNDDFDTWAASQQRLMAWITGAVMTVTSFAVGLVMMADTTAGWAVFGGM